LPSASSIDSINLLFADDDIVDQTESSSEILSLRMEKDKVNFFQEIEPFAHLNYKFKEAQSLINKLVPKSTAAFWRTNGHKFPFLRRLALILYNVPSSSAFIERFYSICGHVCKTKSGNYNLDTIIQRSMLKANIQLLEELNL